MVRTIYHVTGSPDGNKQAGGKSVAIVHMKLGTITKRSDGRYQAGYRDLDGKRKFITCNSEEEVLERFQALHPANVSNVEPAKKRGRPKNDAEGQPAQGMMSSEPDDRMLLANYMLNWLEKFKKGKGTVPLNNRPWKRFSV